jgi:hypothetical protein
MRNLLPSKLKRSWIPPIRPAVWFVLEKLEIYSKQDAKFEKEDVKYNFYSLKGYQILCQDIILKGPLFSGFLQK